MGEGVRDGCVERGNVCASIVAPCQLDDTCTGALKNSSKERSGAGAGAGAVKLKRQLGQVEFDLNHSTMQVLWKVCVCGVKSQAHDTRVGLK